MHSKGTMTTAVKRSFGSDVFKTSNSFLQDTPKTSTTRLRPHSTPATLCWLEKNYELSDGVCIPRNVVYYNYVDFCAKNGMQPVNAASFGKVIVAIIFNCTNHPSVCTFKSLTV